MKTQVDIILEVLGLEKVVTPERLQKFATKNSVVVVISKLRKQGYLIKWNSGKYHFGGKRLSF